MIEANQSPSQDQTIQPAADRQGLYKVFLSYAWKDNEDPGRDWCDWLKEELESFRMPELFRRTATALERSLPSDLNPIHQDKEQFRLGRDLPTTMERNLGLSEWLVVLWSSHAQQSQAVISEVEYFFHYKPPGHVIFVIVEWPELDPTLPRRSENEHCLYTDLRMGGSREQGFCRLESLRATLSARGYTNDNTIREVRNYRRKLSVAVLDIAAAVLGVGPDAIRRHVEQQHQLAQAAELREEQQRLLAQAAELREEQQRLLVQTAQARVKTNRWVSLALGLLLTLVVGLGTVSGLLQWTIASLQKRRVELETENRALAGTNSGISAQNETLQKEKETLSAENAVIQKTIAEQRFQNSAADFARANESFADGKPDHGLAYLARAARLSPEDPAVRAYVWNALVYSTGISTSLPTEVFDVPRTPDRWLDLSLNGELVLVRFQGSSPGLYRRDAGKQYHLVPTKAELKYYALAPDGSGVVRLDASDQAYWSTISALETVTALPFKLPPNTVFRWTGKGTHAVVSVPNKGLQSYDMSTGQPQGNPIRWQGVLFRLFCSSQGTFAAAQGESTNFVLWNLTTGAAVVLPPEVARGVIDFKWVPGLECIAFLLNGGTWGVLNLALSPPKWQPAGPIDLTLEWGAAAIPFSRGNSYHISIAGLASGNRFVFASTAGGFPEDIVPPPKIPNGSPYSFVAGAWMAFSSPDGRHELWDWRPPFPRCLYRFRQVDFQPPSFDILRSTIGAGFEQSKIGVWHAPRAAFNPLMDPLEVRDEPECLSPNGLWRVVGARAQPLRVVKQDDHRQVSIPLQLDRPERATRYKHALVRWSADSKAFDLIVDGLVKTQFAFVIPKTPLNCLNTVVEAYGGIRLPDGKPPEVVPLTERLAIRHRLRELAANPVNGIEDADWAKLITWLMADPNTRTQNP